MAGPNGDGEPGINIANVRLLVCRNHEGALAADRRVNSIIFPLEVLNAVLADERTLLACGWDPDTGTLADVSLVTDWLPTIAPACEWISADACDRAWKRAMVLGPSPHRHRQPPMPH